MQMPRPATFPFSHPEAPRGAYRFMPKTTAMPRPTMVEMLPALKAAALSSSPPALLSSLSSASEVESPWVLWSSPWDVVLPLKPAWSLMM